MICKFKFHGVGQGLFYSAKLYENEKEVGCFIYDCGSESTQTYIKAEVEQFCAEAKRLDFLVISHLHDDHVNGLPDLLAKVTPEKIFLPYFDAKTYKNAFAACLVMGGLAPDSEEYRLLWEWYTQQPSGVTLVGDDSCYSGILQWQFLFFNKHIDDAKIGKLEKALLSLFEKEAVDDIRSYVKKDPALEALKEIFKKTIGKNSQNATSLVMLHHSVNESGTQTLLTGDGGFIRELSERVCKEISTGKQVLAQIPHHGAKAEWKQFQRNIESYVSEFIVSFGLGNQYQHPTTDCIDAIFTAGKPLHLVYQRHSFEGECI